MRAWKTTAACHNVRQVLMYSDVLQMCLLVWCLVLLRQADVIDVCCAVGGLSQQAT